MDATGVGTVERSTQYDGVEVYRLLTQSLRPGDVILTRNRRSKRAVARMKATAVAAMSKSAFSHAMIVTEPPIAIEAMPALGVANFNLTHGFFHDLEHVRVLRYRDPSIARAAAARAGMFLAKRYSLTTFAATLLAGGKADAPTDATFCSALVAEAFRSSGAPEFQSLHPSRTDPGDLERLDGFDSITAKVVALVPAPENIEQMSALDGDRMRSPTSAQGRILGRIQEDVGADVAALIDSHAPEAPRPTAFFETLQFLRENLEALADGSEGVPDSLADGLRAVDSKVAEALRGGELEVLLQDVARVDGASMARVVSQSFQSDPDLDREDVEQMIEDTKRQLEARSYQLDPRHCRTGLSQAWDAWCAITAESLQFFTQRLAALEEVQLRMGWVTRRA